MVIASIIRENISVFTDFENREYFSAQLKGLLFRKNCKMPRKIVAPATFALKIKKRNFRAISECPVKQIPSGDIEALVRKQLQKMLSDISLVMRFAEHSGMSPVEVVECFREEFWNEISPGEYNRLLILLVEKAIVWEDRLELELKTCGVKSLLEEFKNE